VDFDQKTGWNLSKKQDEISPKNSADYFFQIQGEDSLENLGIVSPEKFLRHY
jgi:hypothetical protein